MNSKIELLKQTIEDVDKCDHLTVGSVGIILENHGITDNMHVGKPKEFFNTDDKIAEWYLGQFLNIIHNQSWFAMNGLINQSYNWVTSKGGN